MKRILLAMLFLGTAVCFVGCDAWTKKPATEQPEDKMALQEVKPDAGAKSDAAQPMEEVANPAPDATTPAGGRTHVVQRGDTLYKLARQYYNGDQTQWRRIAQTNQLQPPYALKVGQRLVIP